MPYDQLNKSIRKALQEAGLNTSTPDLRNRETDIPAIVWDLQAAMFTKTSTATMGPVTCSVGFDCLALTRLDAVTLAKSCRAALIESDDFFVTFDDESADLFERGADIEPVYLQSIQSTFTLATLEEE